MMHLIQNKGGPLFKKGVVHVILLWRYTKIYQTLYLSHTINLNMFHCIDNLAMEYIIQVKIKCRRVQFAPCISKETLSIIYALLSIGISIDIICYGKFMTEAFQHIPLLQNTSKLSKYVMNISNKLQWGKVHTWVPTFGMRMIRIHFSYIKGLSCKK